MFLTLWNYLRGYVIIEVTGFSVERFINLAVHKGVYLWDVRRAGEAAEMKVSVAGFKLLRSCARKTKCKVRMRKKNGLPFLMFRYRKRYFLAAGAVFFISALFFLSSFVWLIEVEGNERIAATQIMAFLQENGLSVGTFKYGVDEKGLEKKLLSTFGDLSWINIHLTGTKATVSLTETIPKLPESDKSTPCDIVAAKDGLIASIATMSGTPKVKEGDVVQKGDLLVSGELLIGTEDTGFHSKFVHAQSEVKAKRYVEMTFTVPYEYTIKNYTGKSKKSRGCIVFDKAFHIWKPQKRFDYYDTASERVQLNFGENYPLPAIIITEEYREYIPETRRRTAEEAETLAQSVIKEKIINDFDFETDIMDKTVEFTAEEEYLHVKAVITTIESIGELKQIQPETEPPLE
ncbi:MAG: sporulation protein YqfD [Clostridiales bacterium]|jgi:similar to stage IV sporulation protein|nr:sporulation protein YqfD [Clostridiales bacterium]